MKIPLLDLVMEYGSIKDEVDQALSEVLDSGRFILGPQVSAFEEEMAEFLGVRFAVGVGSGTDALIIALRAAGVGAGDEVIVPAHTFVSTASAVLLIGARPVFVDVDARNFLIEPALVDLAVTGKTKAIIAVHLYGQPASMDELLAIGRQYGLAVLEDNAQAIAAAYKGKMTGAIGTAGCLSFFPGKNLGAYGDAGMITTNDPGIAEQARILRSHGWKTKYMPEALGYNSRLDELQAAVLRVKLRHLRQWTRRRREIARHYVGQLQALEVQVPVELPDRTHVFYRFMIGIKQRDALQVFLQQAGIASETYFQTPLPLTPFWRNHLGEEGGFPVSEAAGRTLLAIPLHPWLSGDQIGYICDTVRRAADAIH